MKCGMNYAYDRRSMGVWQGVTMDCLKIQPGQSCPILLCPVSGLQPSSKQLDTLRRTPMNEAKN
jgi:hypothetical protein